MLKSRADELGETDELRLHWGSGSGRMFFKSIEFALAKVCEMKANLVSSTQRTQKTTLLEKKLSLLPNRFGKCVSSAPWCRARQALEAPILNAAACGGYIYFFVEMTISYAAQPADAFWRRLEILATLDLKAPEILARNRQNGKKGVSPGIRLGGLILATRANPMAFPKDSTSPVPGARNASSWATIRTSARQARSSTCKGRPERSC